jgi:hypothetical protein
MNEWKKERKKEREDVDWHKEGQGTDYPELEFSLRG